MSALGIAGGFATGLAAGKGIRMEKDRKAAQDKKLDDQIRKLGDENGQDPRINAVPPISGGLMGAIDRTEGAGDWNTLYNHAQRDGGAFAGVNVSDMTIDDLYKFSDPSGDYGQYVADARTKVGEARQVATPMGRFQIVGSTLRAAAGQMGLDPSVKFTPKVQQSIAEHLIAQRLSSASDMNSKVAALRQEWHGLRSVPTAELAAAINEWEGR